MIAALTSPSISDAEIAVPSMIATLGEAGSTFGVGEGAAVGAGVAAGLVAGLEVGGRRGVCAAMTINKSRAANAARINLEKFIRGIFLLRWRLPCPRVLPAIWSTIIFEDGNFGKTRQCLSL